jgi:hypothetical protein
MNVAPIDTSHVLELGLSTEVTSYMADNGYPSDVLDKAYAVVSDSGKGYIVYKVSTLSKPLKLADATEDTISLWLCTCSDMRYRQCPDLDENTTEEMGVCKHVAECRKEIKAMNDENQSTL